MKPQLCCCTMWLRALYFVFFSFFLCIFFCLFSAAVLWCTSHGTLTRKVLQLGRFPDSTV